MLGCPQLCSAGCRLALLTVPLRRSEHPGVSHGDALYEPHHFFHCFPPWACFLGRDSARGWGWEQPWSPSLCLACLKTKTSSQLLTSAPHTPALLGGDGGFTRLLLGRGQRPSLLDVRLWRASVNATALRGKVVMVGDLSFLSTRPGDPPPPPSIYCSPAGDGNVPSAFFSLPGDLFQTKVTLCCPGTPLPAGSTAPTELGTCSWVPSPVSITPPLPSPPCPHGRAFAPAQHVASHFPFLSPGQSHHVHPERLGTGLRLPGDRQPGCAPRRGLPVPGLPGRARCSRRHGPRPGAERAKGTRRAELVAGLLWMEAPARLFSRRARWARAVPAPEGLGASTKHVGR